MYSKQDFSEGIVRLNMKEKVNFIGNMGNSSDIIHFET